VDALLAQPPDARAAGIASLLQNWTDGAVKLLVTAAALRLRSTRPDVFLEGDYLPLQADMTVKGHITAFARVSPTGSAAIVIAPHLVSPLVGEERPVPIGDAWKTSRVLLPKSFAALTWKDIFTGAELRPVTNGDTSWLFVGQVLKQLPVALLVK
jgi:(1->4)-alpha-D-glucan 1-alpha-D-glucosylmutase